MPQPYGQQWAPPQQPRPQQFGFTGSHQQPPQIPTQRRAEPTPPKKRKKWPWIIGALILIPILGFAGCTALVGGAVKAVDDARQGGTVNLGETYTYASGIALSASAPKPHNPKNQFIVAKNEQGWESTVTITNGSTKPIGASLVTMSATANGAPTQQYWGDGNGLPTQQIAPGQSLAVPFQFKTPKGTKGSLQIAVAAELNEPVFFNGLLG
ncbi:hypothetical protein LWC35_11325 [Pseudonocardia kujensis]|uniref:hypothetical protein n=1 Tax=Pseudonocardia kujensis TaxID=1128675 RepID=UPI001E5D94C8|nr:hypothetical protein [Pseudonocardia kujensis]MCE0763489.1 hypothetical protein [Pseudonocardia kujensis]